MSRLTNKFYTNKHKDCLSCPYAINALDNINKDFVVVLIDKATDNIALVCKKFMPLLLLENWDWIETPQQILKNKTGGLSANDIIDKNIKDLEIEFGIDNVPIEKHQLPNMYWIPKMHKNTINATTIHKILERSSSFSVKQRTTRKLQVPFFSSFLLILTKFLFLEEDWAML